MRKLLIFVFVFWNVQFLFAQQLAFPPKIEFGRTSNANGPIRYDVRIWGWSANGKVAYSTEYEWSEIIPQINFIILDLVSDKTLFSLCINVDELYMNGEIKIEDVYNLNRNSILNALKKYNIVEQRTEFLQFPIKRNNATYDCRITNVKQGENEYGDDKVLKYTVLVTMDNKRKIMGNFTPPPSVDEVYVKGCFLSPFENRAMVAVAEWSWYQYGTRRLIFIGCHLGVGFN
jgi:hypothetical protein